MSIQSDTPETDAEQKYFFSIDGQMQTLCVHQEFARRLERERNEARRGLESSHKAYVREAEEVARLKSERDALRKVCDELAQQFYVTKTGNNQAHAAWSAYNSLPHVKSK